MAFPTISTLIDDFNRASASNPGANWTQGIYAGEVLNIVFNTALAGPGSWGSATWNVASYGAGIEHYCQLSGNGTFELAWGVTNWATSSPDGYFIHYEHSGTPYIQLWKMVSGGQTSIGATTVVTLGTTDWLGVEHIGTTINVYRQVGGSGTWSLIMTRTDSTFTGAGRFGYLINGAQVDAMYGGTISSGAVYTDSATVTVDLQASSAEFREIIETGSVYVDLQASSTELHEITDANSVYVDVTPSGTEFPAKEYVDANTAAVVITPSGTEFISHETIDAGTVVVALTPSSTEAREVTDVNTVPVAVTPSSTELHEIIDANSVYVDVVPSGVDIQTSGYTDTATVSLALTPSSTQIFAGLETATVPVLITPSGVDDYTSASMVDAATVYLDIQPRTVVEYRLEFDTLLIGTLSSRWSGSLSDRRYSGSINTRRFGGALLDRFWSAVVSDRKWSGILGRM